ncbi:restriction endonuclease subunit S [Corynebacterium confusum]|uniref:restriction endonuclease subunit S n=1 Tax=uncultured Corynebacterium sp. TaxID=159447 RepID=UPI0025CE4C3D|nr:restriction endonuclease subunit S [uncultured Corynebacterium sp.]
MGFTTWMQESPAWRIVPTSIIFSERSEKSADEDVHLTPSQKLGVIPQEEYIERTGAQVVKNRVGSDNMKRVMPGDFISHLRSFQGGLERTTIPGKVSNAYTVLRPRREIEGKYYSYLFKSASFIEGLANLTDQLRDGQTINFARLALFSLPLPPLPTQRAIADYLDRETAEIDGMRADLDEMERLLTERRSAIISEALFNGDHEDERTDRTSYLAPLWKFAEVTPSTPEFAELTEEDEVTFIPLEDIWPSYTADDFQTVNWQPRLTGYTPFRRGDLLLPKVTPTVTHGRTMIANISTDVGVASTEVYTLRTRPGTNPRWIAHMLVGTEFLGLAGASVQGTGGLKRISTQFVESYLLPNITLDEQRRIADEIDRETAEIESMLEDITKQRDLLAERRAAVISAAVTGQIDIPASLDDKDEPHA